MLTVISKGGTVPQDMAVQILLLDGKETLGQQRENETAAGLHGST